jgi:hypothetical protein
MFHKCPLDTGTQGDVVISPPGRMVPKVIFRHAVTWGGYHCGFTKRLASYQSGEGPGLSSGDRLIVDLVNAKNGGKGREQQKTRQAQLQGRLARHNGARQTSGALNRDEARAQHLPIERYAIDKRDQNTVTDTSRKEGKKL